MLPIWLAWHVVPADAAATSELRPELLAADIEEVKTLTHVNAQMFGLQA